MKRAPNPFVKVLHSATPALASGIAAAAYGLGAVAFSIARGGEPAVLPDQSLEYEAPSLYASISYDLSPAPVAHAAPFTPVDMDESDSNATAGERLRPMIALVIDDLGLNVDAVRRTAELPAPLTMAVLPYAADAAFSAQIATGLGHDVIVHMPMEPLGLADPGPNALQLALSDADIEARVRWALARVPGATGLNNHMGSRFTQDPRAMRVALAAAGDQAPLFLDSMTSGESRGAAVARGLGLTTFERDIFLDHVIDEAAIGARLADTESLAELRGWAIVIGHPHDVTLSALENWVVDAQSRGFEFVTLGALEARLQADVPEPIQASMVQ